MKYNTKHPLLTGALFLTLAGFFSRFIGFFYKIFLSRVIGAEGMGIYQLVFPVAVLPLLPPEIPEKQRDFFWQEQGFHW